MAVFDLLHAGFALEAQVSAVEADEFCAQLDGAGEQINEVLLGNVALAVVGDAVLLALLGDVLVDDLAVDRLAGLLVNVLVGGEEFQG